MIRCRSAAMVCLMLAAASAAADVDRELMIRLSGSMVKVEAITPGGYELGSGVIVAPGQVATNCHVTRRATAIHVMQGGLRRKVDAQAANVAQDLCLLRVTGLEGTPAELSDAAGTPRGEPLVAVGYTGGLGISFSEGSLVSRHRMDTGAVLRSSTFFNSGASGGGLFDSKGQLLGILTFRLRGAEQNYFSVPVAWIRDLARQAAFTPVMPVQGQTFWELSGDAKAPFLQVAELKQTGQWAQLANVARRWMDADPLDASASAALGDALQRLGDFSGAESAWARQVTLEPDDADGWWQLGQLQARQGRRDHARDALTHLQRLNAALAAQLTQLLEIP